MSVHNHVIEIPLTNKAVVYAIEKHAKQMRRGSGLLYIVHPISVLAIVRKYKNSKHYDELGAAAVLHDVAEDCGVTSEELVAGFGEMVAGLVMELTNDPDEVRRLGKQEYLDCKLANLSSYALVIKLADMLANMTENPSQKSVNRMVHNCKVLLERADDRLSGTHRSLVEEILWNAGRLYEVE